MARENNILIVDDDPHFRKSLSDILRLKGFHPMSTGLGDSALEMVRENVPSVALIDLKLPDIDGLTIMGEIKKRFANTECIVLTGHASQASAIEAINMGAFSYVQKPYDIEQLLVTIRRAVEKQQVQKALQESEERYRMLFNSSMDAVFVYRLEPKTGPGHFIEVNDLACQKLEYEREELLSLSFMDIEHEEKRHRHPWIIERLNSAKHALFETDLVSKQKRIIPFEINAHLFDFNGYPTVLASARDVTARKRTEKINQAFSVLGYQLSAIDNPRDAADFILATAYQLLGWDAGYIVLHSGGEQKFYYLVYYDTIGGECRKVPPPDESLVAEALKSAIKKKARLILRKHPDETDEHGFIPFGDTNRRSASLMFVPLRKGADNVGILSIQSYTPFAYHETDLELLQILADHCSSALDRTFTGEKLLRKEFLTRKLSELGKDLAAATTPKDAAMKILDTADALFGWDACYINFYSPVENKVYDLVSIDTIDGKRIEAPPILDGTAFNMISRRTVEEGAILILRESEQVVDDKDLIPFGDTSRPSLSLMFVPLRKGEKTVGFLSIQSYTPKAYTGDDLTSLQILADHCSGALERTLAEARLRDSEERLRLLTEQIPALFWTTDASLRFTLLQGAGFKDLAIDPHQLSGQTIFQFFQTIDESFPPIIMHRRAIEGESATYEMELMGKIFHTHIEPLRSGSGDIIGCINVAHDITEQKKAEEALRQARDDLEKRVEARTAELSKSNALLRREIADRIRVEEELAQSLSLLRATFESVTDGILVIGNENNTVSFNRKFVEMWDLSPTLVETRNYDEIMDHILHRLKHPRIYETRINGLSRHPEKESFDVFELNDGLIFECYSNPQRVREKCMGRVWSFRDATKRKQAEKKLERSEAIYREAIENAAGVPYRLIYKQKNYDFVGEGILSLLGYSPREFSFDLLRSIIREINILDPEAPSDHVECVEAFKKGKLDQYRVDLRVLTRAGEEKWIGDCSVPICHEKTGKVIGSLGILQDVTNRKKMEEQARRRNEQLVQTEKLVALGTLVSGVAHEINNPNNFIMLNSPILRDAWLNILPILDEYHKNNGDFLAGGVYYSDMRDHIPDLCSCIATGATRIKNIVQELRDFARENPSEQMEPVDINSVVKSSLTLLENMIKKATDNFSVDYGEDIPKIKGNFQRLEQVVINLLQNACQALTDKEEHISVSTRYDSQQGKVFIRIRDGGAGIPSEIQKQIMDPFFTTKRDTGGVGLGLSISTKIISDHKGNLDLTSTPGEGTLAAIGLPDGV